MMMESSLLNIARSYFDDSAFEELLVWMEISPDHLRKGLDTVFPVLFIGFQRKSHMELNRYLEVLKGSLIDFDFSAFSTQEESSNRIYQNTHLVSSLFGSSLDVVTANLSEYIKVSGTMATKLLQLGFYAVVGALTYDGANWDIGRIFRELESNKNEFEAAMPIDLELDMLEDEVMTKPEMVEGKSITPYKQESSLVDPLRSVLIDDPIIQNNANEGVKKKPSKGVIKRSLNITLLWWLLPVLIILTILGFVRSCNLDLFSS